MIKTLSIIRKADIILAAVLVAAGLMLSFFFTFGDSAGDTLTVTIDGQVYGSYSLLEDNTIKINENGHKNVIEIKNGSADMISSNCKGQDCVEQHSISAGGETIVCLPHRLILEVTGGEDKYDSIAK